MTQAKISPASRRRFQHAIVAGGSIAGLLAARVLADHFERVTVLERDSIGGHAESRTGVPQGRHLHALLLRGRMIVETLFPDITADLCDKGAMLLDAGEDIAWHHGGGWRTRPDFSFRVLSMSRPLLEGMIAQRVRALPNVTILEGARIRGLTSNGTGRITGIRLKGSEDRTPETTIGADLVVDALGRGSRMSRWLADLGLPTPRTELLPAEVAYATRMFERPAGSEARAMLVTGAPAPRSGGLFPIEGNRWLLTLIGFFQDSMPERDDDYLAFARALPTPAVWEFVRDLKPVSEITSFRFAGSQRRRYEELDRAPGGLIAIGDAVCSFNPVYGQGMTVSAVEAETLGTMLREAGHIDRFGPEFARGWFRRIAPVVDAAWGGVSIEDLRFPQLAYRRPMSLRPIQWYMSRMHQATHRSGAVTGQFYRVMNFLDPPTTLFRPGLMADVLFGGLMRPKASPSAQGSRTAYPALPASAGHGAG